MAPNFNYEHTLLSFTKLQQEFKQKAVQDTHSGNVADLESWEGKDLNALDVCNPKHYALKIVQQPKHARIGTPGEAERRPIDPPPVVQIYLNFPHKQYNDLAYLSPYYFLFTTLYTGDEKMNPVEPHSKLFGTLASSIYILRNTENRKGAYFVFPALSVQQEGRFRLKFQLFSIQNAAVRHITAVMSEPFQVFSAKAFPGMDESTPLSRVFAEQGIKIRKRSEVPDKRRIEACSIESPRHSVSHSFTPGPLDNMTKRTKLASLGTMQRSGRSTSIYDPNGSDSNVDRSRSSSSETVSMPHALQPETGGVASPIGSEGKSTPMGEPLLLQTQFRQPSAPSNPGIMYVRLDSSGNVYADAKKYLHAHPVAYHLGPTQYALPHHAISMDGRFDAQTGQRIEPKAVKVEQEGKSSWQLSAPDPAARHLKVVGYMPSHSATPPPGHPQHTHYIQQVQAQAANSANYARSMMAQPPIYAHAAASPYAHTHPHQAYITYEMPQMGMRPAVVPGMWDGQAQQYQQHHGNAAQGMRQYPPLQLVQIAFPHDNQRRASEPQVTVLPPLREIYQPVAKPEGSVVIPVTMATAAPENVIVAKCNSRQCTTSTLRQPPTPCPSRPSRPPPRTAYFVLWARYCVSKTAARKLVSPPKI